jgi:hypothetical protein
MKVPQFDGEEMREEFWRRRVSSANLYDGSMLKIT